MWSVGADPAQVWVSGWSSGCWGRGPSGARMKGCVFQKYRGTCLPPAAVNPSVLVTFLLTLSGLLVLAAVFGQLSPCLAPGLLGPLARPASSPVCGGSLWGGTTLETPFPSSHGFKDHPPVLPNLSCPLELCGSRPSPFRVSRRKPPKMLPPPQPHPQVRGCQRGLHPSQATCSVNLACPAALTFPGKAHTPGVLVCCVAARPHLAHQHPKPVGLSVIGSKAEGWLGPGLAPESPHSHPRLCQTSVCTSSWRLYADPLPGPHGA